MLTYWWVQIVLFSIFYTFKWAQSSRAEYWYQIDEPIILLLRKVYNFSYPSHDSYFSHHQSLANYRHLISIFWMNENLPYNWQLHCFMTLWLQIPMPRSSTSSYLSKKIILETCLELHLTPFLSLLASYCLLIPFPILQSSPVCFSVSDNHRLWFLPFSSPLQFTSGFHGCLLLFSKRDASGCTLSGWHREPEGSGRTSNRIITDSMHPIETHTPSGVDAA